jgi:hypothetical protein
MIPPINDSDFGFLILVTPDMDFLGIACYDDPALVRQNDLSFKKHAERNTIVKFAQQCQISLLRDLTLLCKFNHHSSPETESPAARVSSLWNGENEVTASSSYAEMHHIGRLAIHGHRHIHIAARGQRYARQRVLAGMDARLFTLLF